jgi:hypothetical protein
MSFDPNERRALAKLVDELIPAGDGFPSASEAGVCREGLDAVLTARPDLEAGLKELLGKAAKSESVQVVDDLRSHDVAAFGVLAEFAAAAYFMNPVVRQAIGYGGQNPHPIDPRSDYLDDDLLEPVIRRGPIYRPTPGNAT